MTLTKNDKNDSDQAQLPRISVIVVNWNRRRLLASCLQSLVMQQGVAFEIIVVDNGSSDGSAEEVIRIRETAAMPVLLIQNADNRGFCAANNQGIKEARGELIALLNNDAEASPGWLAELGAALDRHPEAGMAASKIVVWDDPSRIDKCGHLIWPDGQNRGRGTGQIDRGQFDREEEVLWPDGCAAMYRSKMLAQIGGFDEDLFAYGDDAELGFRARAAGWSCVYTHHAVVRHHRSATLGLLSSRRLELIERNRVLLAVRHFPLSLLLKNPYWFGLRLFAGLMAALRGRGEAGKYRGLAEKVRLALAMLSGFVQGVLMIPATWTKRRAFMSLRKLSDREITALLFRFRISLRELSERAA
ncbi:MAG: glycosyltransferase family 2 protein [Bryobacteraceae bacterium]|nr:glycosyltransferase family 2 protein [Bryobacteraceae bacterium]